MAMKGYSAFPKAPALLSDCLMSYPRHSLRESNSYAEMQSVYSGAPADWATNIRERRTWLPTLIIFQSNYIGLKKLAGNLVKFFIMFLMRNSKRLVSFFYVTHDFLTVSKSYLSKTFFSLSYKSRLILFYFFFVSLRGSLCMLQHSVTLFLVLFQWAFINCALDGFLIYTIIHEYS